MKQIWLISRKIFLKTTKFLVNASNRLVRVNIVLRLRFSRFVA
ncbi:hypothetical protein [Campylobacter showae]|uniref:Uncharacterized protein n=1 Tax=Campylobacter showae CSUNSWCD TaxID=1244083 RepID=M5IQN7_9BACT|nr:hypothetical protein [Campylobacter showae]EKU11361.1 hypothetical protein CSUNSWCD_1987 [Campylobacter showae CSUNSWCD]